MANVALSQVVNPGDLILAFGPTKALMLLAKSAPGSSDPNPSISSIVVKVVYDHIPGKFGHWTLSGPDIFYLEKDEKDDRLDNSSDDRSDDHHELPLSYLLDSLAEPDENKDQACQAFFIVNPHGRDVLEYFYKGECPWCRGASLFCTGCGDVSEVFPEFFASCGYSIACPVCLGYDIALDDITTLQFLDPLENRLFTNKNSPWIVYMTETEVQTLKNDILYCKRRRLERINSRMEEMGLEPADIETELQEFKESYW